MPDYSKGKIYKIVPKRDVTTEENWKPYFGSTVQTLSKRMVSHRANYKKYQNGKKWVMGSFELFDKFGIENCEIIWLEDFPCGSKPELESRERKWFDDNENCNKNKPRRTEEELKNCWKYQRQLELHPNHNKDYYQAKLAKNPKAVMKILQKGTRKAQKVGLTTMKEVREKIKINYF